MAPNSVMCVTDVSITLIFICLVAMHIVMFHTLCVIDVFPRCNEFFYK